MHELGVVFFSIKEINKIAEEQGIKKINSVTIRIGEVNTVIPEMFVDCWDWAVKKETVLKDAKVKIERIKAITHCEGCGKDYDTVKFGKICPYCNSMNTYLVQGNEIEIKELEVVD